MVVVVKFSALAFSSFNLVRNRKQQHAFYAQASEVFHMVKRYVRLSVFEEAQDLKFRIVEPFIEA